MLHESLCYLSNSSWPNSVHVTLEKSGNLIHFDDYRVLKNITIPDHYLIPFLTVATTFWRSQKFFHPRTSSIHIRKHLWMQLMFPKYRLLHYLECLKSPARNLKYATRHRLFRGEVKRLKILKGLDLFFCYVNCSVRWENSLASYTLILNNYDLFINGNKRSLRFCSPKIRRRYLQSEISQKHSLSQFEKTFENS